jgi:hypothetical protein
LKEILLYLGLPQDTTLQSLGLSLSGCEVEETNKELGEKLMKLHPKLVKEVPQVCSDTVGSLLTASEKVKLSIPSTTNNMLMCALAYFDKKVHYKAKIESFLTFLLIVNFLVQTLQCKKSFILCIAHKNMKKTPSKIGYFNKIVGFNGPKQ